MRLGKYGGQCTDLMCETMSPLKAVSRNYNSLSLSEPEAQITAGLWAGILKAI